MHKSTIAIGVFLFTLNSFGVEYSINLWIYGNNGMYAAASKIEREADQSDAMSLSQKCSQLGGQIDGKILSGTTNFKAIIFGTCKIQR